MDYVAIAKQALGKASGGSAVEVASRPCAPTGNEINELNELRVSPRDADDIARLRPRLAELRQRIDAGFVVLRAREEANNTAHPYPLWLAKWEKLLRQYEATADKLAEITRCPIGDCSRFESCSTAPAPCLTVGPGGTP